MHAGGGPARERSWGVAVAMSARDKTQRGHRRYRNESNGDDRASHMVLSGCRGEEPHPRGLPSAYWDGGAAAPDRGRGSGWALGRP